MSPVLTDFSIEFILGMIILVIVIANLNRQFITRQNTNKCINLSIVFNVLLNY